MFVFVYLYGLRSTHTDLYIDKVPDLLSRVAEAELEVQVSASTYLSRGENADVSCMYCTCMYKYPVRPYRCAFVGNTKRLTYGHVI